jgi:hypothetical protein
MEEKDLYWLAGFLEGEGNFYFGDNLHKDGHSNKQFCIGAGSTDKDVIERAAKLMGSKVYGPYKKNKGKDKDCYQLRISKREKVLSLCILLYPLMGQRRKQKIDDLFVANKNYPKYLPKTHCKHGHEFTKENTYIPPDKKQRTCKECRKIRARKYRRKE